MGRPKKLSEEQIHKIRNDETKTAKEFADEFGVNVYTIYKVILGQGAYKVPGSVNEVV